MGTSSPPTPDMPVPVASRRLPLNTIQTQLKSPMTSSSGEVTLLSAGLGAHDNNVIPPFHDARTLVVCFDGTGDQFNADNSNIVQFFSLLKKDDKSQQLVYYQAGIGTYTIPEIATPLTANWKKTVDKAIANHLDAHVMGGYEFLMEQYHAEDKICIFGFSRGAYTARALAGMIHKVGLLPAGNHQQVPFAYKMFTRTDEIGWHQSTMFKKSFSVNVEIEFVGVWDTVCSVGLIPHHLPFTHSNTAIRYFRHAISLDERRAKFKANHWHLLRDDDQKGTNLGEMPRSNQRHPYYHSNHNAKRAEDENDGPTKTDVREVWFAGCHCDIGGGSVPNGTRNSLARIPLRWMIRECFRAGTGIQFYRQYFKDVGLDPDTFLDPRPPARVSQVEDAAAHAAEPTDTLIDEVQASSTAASTFVSEEAEELADARSPIYDQLKITMPWWILELIPMLQRKQDRWDYSWKYHWKMNLGHARTVPEPIHENGEKFLVHRSVKIRMEAEGLKGGKYVPKAKFQKFDYEWVD